ASKSQPPTHASPAHHPEPEHAAPSHHPEPAREPKPAPASHAAPVHQAMGATPAGGAARPQMIHPQGTGMTTPAHTTRLAPAAASSPARSAKVAPAAPSQAQRAGATHTNTALKFTGDVQPAVSSPRDPGTGVGSSFHPPAGALTSH